VQNIIILIKNHSAPARPQDEVILCIRPETIRIAKGSEEGEENTIAGKVTNYIFEGATIRYWVNALEQEWVVDVFDPAEVLEPDTKVSLRLKPERIHLMLVNP
jgi:ABC-type Fe3+/spermidine/putrescine transport system ATPase subunit